MAIVQRTEVQQLSRQYSCANPMMEVIERIARVAFIVSNRCILQCSIVSYPGSEAKNPSDQGSIRIYQDAITLNCVTMHRTLLSQEGSETS